MASGIDIANRAKAEMNEIGGRCGNNNKYTHWYSDNVDNIGYNFWWCAAFVTYVVRACGISTSIVPNYAYCPDCISWARSRGRLHSKSQLTSGAYTPQPGDIFLREGHTGIIVSVSGSQFTTVEGNTGGSTNNRTVGSHTWSFSSGNYDYVFNPDYPDKSAIVLENSVSNNRAKVIGTICEPIKFSHETYGESFYIFTVSVPRFSGREDKIRVITPGLLIIGNDYSVGDKVIIAGQFRSFNDMNEGKSRLVLTLFAKEMVRIRIR